ncbi:MAG TPA: periplasmic heavy metal sensor [Thermoanaerobaculia bacterium]|nr:periplasmic heavy metal sensor [Thermoanaerobaculia bacterium]
MRSRSLLFLVLPMLLGTAAAVAQGAPDDPLHDHLFPPELVMQNQQAIGLGDDQRTALKADLRQAQQRFTELQWKLDDEMERFVALVKAPQVDEPQALAQLDKVLAAEREVKRTQISLLIRIKDHLRPDQQARLQEIRRKAGGK